MICDPVQAGSLGPYNVNVIVPVGLKPRFRRAESFRSVASFAHVAGGQAGSVWVWIVGLALRTVTGSAAQPLLTGWLSAFPLYAAVQCQTPAALAVKVSLVAQS